MSSAASSSNQQAPSSNQQTPSSNQQPVQVLVTEDWYICCDPCCPDKCGDTNFSLRIRPDRRYAQPVPPVGADGRQRCAICRHAWGDQVRPEQRAGRVDEIRWRGDHRRQCLCAETVYQETYYVWRMTGEGGA